MTATSIIQTDEPTILSEIREIMGRINILGPHYCLQQISSTLLQTRATTNTTVQKIKQIAILTEMDTIEPRDAIALFEMLLDENPKTKHPDIPIDIHQV